MAGADELPERHQAGFGSTPDPEAGGTAARAALVTPGHALKKRRPCHLCGHGRGLVKSIQSFAKSFDERIPAAKESAHVSEWDGFRCRGGRRDNLRSSQPRQFPRRTGPPPLGYMADGASLPAD